MKKQTKRERKIQQQHRENRSIQAKLCPNCQIEKPIIGGFGRYKSCGRVYINSWCKMCQRENNKKQRQKSGHREKHAAYMREYRKRFKQERLKPER